MNAAGRPSAGANGLAGLVNLFKPSGISSRHAVDAVCRLAGTKKAGHAGTLDPLASGVLVVCLGWATRLVELVQCFEKRYRATFLLGVNSNTDDVTGILQQVPGAAAPSLEEIVRQAALLTGLIRQVPPDYSAAHVNGRRAYQLARRGLPVALPAREVYVRQIEIACYEYPRLELLIECGSGTYVRSLGRDLGRALGTGACMQSLVRERVGPFGIEHAQSLEALGLLPFDQWLLPPLAAAEGLPRHLCTSEEALQIARGRPIAALRPAGDAAGPVALLDQEGNSLLAIAQWDASAGALRPRRVFAGW